MAEEQDEGMVVEFIISVEIEKMIDRIRHPLRNEIQVKAERICFLWTDLFNEDEKNKIDTVISGAIAQVKNITFDNEIDFNRQIKQIFNNITINVKDIIDKIDNTTLDNANLFSIRTYNWNDKINYIIENRQTQSYDTVMFKLFLEFNKIKEGLKEKYHDNGVYEDKEHDLDVFANEIAGKIRNWDINNRIKISVGEDPILECPYTFTPKMYSDLGVLNVNFMSVDDYVMSSSSDKFAKYKNIACSNLRENTALELETKINALHSKKDHAEVNRRVSGILDVAVQEIKGAECSEFTNDVASEFDTCLSERMRYITREVVTYLNSARPEVIFRRLKATDKRYTDITVNSETVKLINNIKLINTYLEGRINSEKKGDFYKETARIQLKTSIENEYFLILQEDVRQRDMFASGNFNPGVSSYRPEPVASLERILGLVPGQTDEDLAIRNQDAKVKRNFIEYENNLLEHQIEEANKQLKEIKKFTDPPKDPPENDPVTGKPKKKEFPVKRYHPADPRYVPPVVPEFVPGKLYRNLPQPAKKDRRYIFGTMVAGKAGIDAHMMFDEVALSIAPPPLTDLVFSGTLLNAVTDAINEYNCCPNSNQTMEIDLDFFLTHENDTLQVLFKDFVSAFVKESEMSNMRVAMSTQAKLCMYTELNYRKRKFKDYVAKNKS